MRSRADSSSDDAPPLDALLASEAPRSHWRRRLWLVVAAVAVAAAALAALAWLARKPAQEPRYATAAVTRGRLVVEVAATGNLQPLNRVEVSSELSGIVTEVLVDENDQVTKGQVLARLDLAKLRDAVARSNANLVVAAAQVQQAEATVLETRTVLQRFAQVAALSQGKVPSQRELDSAEADLKRAEATEASARANVRQARANLQSDETNLRKASIRSPIDGVVLSRSVEPGQTVAAMFQAPVLFALAEDLAKMELRVDVDEADVGRVATGQRATFTVDAWPERTYSGVITRVGFGSQVKEGVVSYPAVLAVDNDDLSLRPGMTGSADIVTVTRDNALLVPNAALRFVPPAASQTQGRPSGGIVGRLMPRPPRQRRQPQPPTARGKGRLWLLQGGEAVPLEVQIGASDGHVTELLGGALEVGSEVITEATGSRR